MGAECVEGSRLATTSTPQGRSRRALDNGSRSNGRSAKVRFPTSVVLVAPAIGKGQRRRTRLSQPVHCWLVVRTAGQSQADDDAPGMRTRIMTLGPGDSRQVLSPPGPDAAWSTPSIVVAAHLGSGPSLARCQSSNPCEPVGGVFVDVELCSVVTPRRSLVGMGQHRPAASSKYSLSPLRVERYRKRGREGVSFLCVRHLRQGSGVRVDMDPLGLEWVDSICLAPGGPGRKVLAVYRHR